MDNFEEINKDTVQRLIAQWRVNPAAADYIIARSNLAIQIAVFLVFVYSLLYLLLFSFRVVAKDFLAAILWLLAFCVIYFIYDFIYTRRQAKRRFKRELWLLKTLLENEEAKQFYKAGGASGSQEFFNRKNIENWKWDFDFTSHIRRIVTNFFIKEFNITNNKVIELGCAAGYFLDILSSYKNITYGIDLDMDSLQRITKRKGLYLCQADIESIPFKSDSFGAVFFLEVIEHLSFPQAAIAEAGRILKPGGILFLSTPNTNCMSISYFLNPVKFFVQFLAIWFEALRMPKPLINLWRGQYFFHTAFSRKGIRKLLGSSFKIKYWATYGIGGGLIGLLLKLKPSVRRILNQLNDMEHRGQYFDNYMQERKMLASIEMKYGNWLGKVNIFLQVLPLIKLIGTNHFIILEKT